MGDLASGIGNAVGQISGDLLGSNNSARAAQGIANNQLAASREQLASDQSTRKQALDLAKPSYDEMAAVHQQFQMSKDLLATQMTNLNTERDLLNSVDPALRAAAQQATDLMNGKSAASLKPEMDLRAQQRNQLENTLRDRLGSGFAESSAGQEALNQFDLQSSQFAAQTQQNAIGQYLGISASVRPNMVNNTNAAFSGASQLAQSGLAGMQNISARQVGAISATPINYQNVIATAGAPYAGDYYRGQAQQNFMGQAANAGVLAMMKY